MSPASPTATAPPAGACRARDLLGAVPDARWAPGADVAEPVPHGEIFAPSGEGSGAAAALALALDRWRACPPAGIADAADRRAVVWVQTREAARLTGVPYRPGLPPLVRDRLIHVLAATVPDALFALEEVLGCREVAFVLGEMTGNPRALDFTASRRLTLAVERYGVPLWLVRLDAERDLSAARMRWSVRAAPSQPSRWDAQAPGAPAWQAQLFRARRYRPGDWLLEDRGGRLFASVAGAGDDPRDEEARTVRG